MNKIFLSGAIAAILAAPAMAQTTSLDQLSQQVQQLKEQNDRLGAEVDYLKEQTKASRKDSANTALDISNLKTNTSKFTWSGDFRYRDEEIKTATDNSKDEHTRSRQRIRVRFGVGIKVNDTINAKIQLSTTNSGNDSSRSTNQTEGTGWDRKPVSFDLAYVDWKALNTVNVQLGKMPMPWATTASYFWDKDLTPEGMAVKFQRGALFANASYTLLNERNTGNNQAASTDARMEGIQAGWKQAFSKSTLTAALGYFNVMGVQDRAVKTSTGAGTACTVDGAFGAGQGTGDNSFGNSTYTSTGAAVGDAPNSCTRLSSDFNLITALVQYDFTVGKYPMSTFVDYMKNQGAKAITVGSTTDKYNVAYAVGVTFNKASAPKSWETSLVYQKTGKDAVFAQFVDSDFGGGQTDAKGWAIKGGYVPAANWTLNGTLFINKLNNDGETSASVKHDIHYKRLQLDLNYKF